MLAAINKKPQEFFQRAVKHMFLDMSLSRTSECINILEACSEIASVFAYNAPGCFLTGPRRNLPTYLPFDPFGVSLSISPAPLDCVARTLRCSATSHILK
ncbi:hypothetical protein DFH07DRAFT_960658 [Mycena maculata]|uniref:Uncharacterized protein n=1 Tax=Mycena maculata TaxID=230809 RepID=A0AAD7IX10_9AGAR|nr:hypothetical protein DFH07DRAFT_960658 [Mycena maculata]